MKRLILIVALGVLVAADVCAHDCECEPKPKEPECGVASPCQGLGSLCPNERNQVDYSFHDPPCFCLSCDGYQLVWIMEGETWLPEGTPIGGRQTEWGPCREGSKWPYCEIESTEATVCGAALLAWLRYLEGWFDKLYGRKYVYEDE
jgi:hypothetical protein